MLRDAFAGAGWLACACCAASSARWSEERLVNWRATGLLGDWVGSCVLFHQMFRFRGASALCDLPRGAFFCEVTP